MSSGCGQRPRRRPRTQWTNPLALLGLAAACAVASVAAVYTDFDNPHQCPGNCMAPTNGRCSEDLEQVCTCHYPFTGPAADCSERECPAHIAWAAVPDENENVHLDGAPCSNRGKCNERTGVCKCDKLFTGDACQRMECPNDCNGRGRCVTLREAAELSNGRSLVRELRYNVWDADKIMGCVCDPGFAGYDCSIRECPMGSDPVSQGAIERQTVRTSATDEDEIQEIIITGQSGTQGDEVQTFTVSVTALAALDEYPEGTFQLGFDSTDLNTCKMCAVRADLTTAVIELDSTAASPASRAIRIGQNVEAALEALSNIDDVTVTTTLVVTPGAGGMSTATYTIAITFVGVEVGGNVPELEIIPIPIVPVDLRVFSTITEADGDEVSGSLIIGFDPTATYANLPGSTDTFPPPATFLADGDETVACQDVSAPPVTSVTISVDATATEVLTALESLDGIEPGGIVVSRVYVGGPGVKWRVVFASGICQRANRPSFTIDPASPVTPRGTSSASFIASAATCSVATIVDGSFIQGTFKITLDYGGWISSTAPIAWDATATQVKSIIEATDDALGLVDVTRTRYYAGGLDDWNGGYEWSITFRSVGENIPTFDFSVDFALDASPGASTADAAAAVVYESKHFETQVIRTVITDVDEVQRISITQPAALDEVQTIRVTTTTGEPTGDFRLRFDTLTNCNLCPTSKLQDAETVMIQIDPTPTRTLAERAAFTAEIIRVRLEFLENVDVVAVSGIHVTDGTNSGYEWRVTFTGVEVGGNVPMLQVSYQSNEPSAWTVSVTETVPGDEVSGTLVLQYDDSVSDPTTPGMTNYPLPSEQSGEALTAGGPDQTVALAAGARESTIASAINALAGLTWPGGSTVTVSRELNGGPGPDWLVTFSGTPRGRGNRPLLICVPTLANGGTCVSSEDVQGSFLSGSFSIRLDYEALSVTSAFIPWHSTASEVQTVIENLYPDNKLGSVTVTRAKYTPGGDDSWGGGFTWVATFLSLREDVPAMQINPALSGLGAAIGDAGATALFVAAESFDGSENGEVNEVQLIDCECAATCSGSFKLSFRGEQTTEIAHSASAADVRLALEALEGIPAIRVDMVGGATVCDADGVTTGITFTHNPGDLPALYIDPFDASAMTLASTAASSPKFRFREGPLEPRGDQGFRAKQGTRILRECSGRGICDRGTGECICSTDAAGATLFGASNNAGGDAAAGPATSSFGVANCGFPLAPVTVCPIDYNLGQCTGHGTCSGWPDYRCSCNSDRKGTSCLLVSCPTGRAWFDEAIRDDVAHEFGTECSAMGVCIDSVGQCLCRPGFQGLSCSLMPCPSCGEGGACYTLRDLAFADLDAEGNQNAAATYVSGWDSDMIRGCACENTKYVGPREKSVARRGGYDCTRHECVATEDPRRPDRNDRAEEVQQIVCTATSGGFSLQFQNHTTTTVLFDDAILARHKTSPTRNSLEEALEVLLPAPYSVVVLVPNPAGSDVDSYSAADKGVCTTSKTIEVHFFGLQGDVPLLRVATSSLQGGTVSITQSQAGSRVPNECSRRGVCDRRTGQCVCQPQYGSSDGDFNAGFLGDCAHLDALYRFPR